MFDDNFNQDEKNKTLNEIITTNTKGEILRITQLHPNGKKKSVANFENNKLHGSYELYYPSEIKESEFFYISGKLHGTCRNYDENQNIIQQMEYRNGLLHGTFSIFQENQKTFEMYYLNGKKNGPMKIYDNNGQVLQVINYQNDLQHGECLNYHPLNGELIQVSEYLNGKKHGKTLSFLPNSGGRVYEESFYTKDLLEGFVYRYYPSGKIQEICEYKKGKPTGAPVLFDENGTALEDKKKEPQPNKLNQFILQKFWKKDQ